MFEFLNSFAGLGDQGLIIFFAVFVIFTILAYKLVKFVFKALMLGLVAAMFPIVGNMVLGMSIEISLYNMVWFALTGIALFIAYSAIRMGWKFVKLIFSPLKLFKRGGGGKKESKPKETPKPSASE
ncbi:MAG: hypothetical protein NTU57_04050 [Candidatus Aenigmarchaeota archaeon]|nr:hypothetical protein [Candidatus Aenigmarchaeota archaeon]